MIETAKSALPLPQIQSATVCVVAMLRSSASNAPIPKSSERYETQYHDTGEIAGWRLFGEVPPPPNAGLCAPREAFARRGSDHPPRVDVRLTLDPGIVPALFKSVDFDGWDNSVRSVLEASLNHEVESTWKGQCGCVLVLEDANLPHLPIEAPDTAEYVKRWLQFIGAADTVAYPSRLGETILISPPHVMGTNDRVLCVLTRPHPGAIKAGDLALADSVDSLLNCWAEVIHIEGIRSALSKVPFLQRSLKQYLDQIGWYKAPRKRLAHYEQTFLPDREQSIELVVNARRELARAEGNLRFNPWRRLAETTTTLPVGKPSRSAYPVAAAAASGIQRPFDGVSRDLTEIETRQEGVSNYLRDAASAHTERANWNMQLMIFALTIATILFGAASLYLDWQTYLAGQALPDNAKTQMVVPPPPAPSGPTAAPPAPVSGPVPVTYRPSGTAASARCDPRPHPPTANFRDTGGRGGFRIQVNEACEWAVKSEAEWVLVGADSRFGSGEVEYSVRANEGRRSRSTVIRVNGRTHRITQDAPTVVP